jgi:hypothetical protein
MKKIIIVIFLMFEVYAVLGQSMPNEKKSETKDAVRIGFSFLNVWTDVQGNTPKLFRKPSLGGVVKVEYYPLDFLGLTAGIGYQQRGYGLILPDTGFVAPSLNTYRNRIRTNNLEFPLGLILKTPKPIAGGSTWMLASVGISPLRMFEANDIYLSVEDGFHVVKDVTKNFTSSDSPIFVSIGPEIDTSAGFLQVQLIGSFGQKNVFTSENNPKGYSGKNRYFGISIGCTF